MADLSAANVTIMAARTSSKVADGLIQTKQRVWTDSITLAGASVDDEIIIAVLPVGAKVQEVIVYNAALGTSTTLSAGVTGALAQFFAAASTATAGKLTSNLVAAVNYVITSTTTEIRLLLEGGSGTGALATEVRYTLS